MTLNSWDDWTKVDQNQLFICQENADEWFNQVTNWIDFWCIQKTSEYENLNDNDNDNSIDKHDMSRWECSRIF
jgi:hypothetical protein